MRPAIFAFWLGIITAEPQTLCRVDQKIAAFGAQIQRTVLFPAIHLYKIIEDSCFFFFVHINMTDLVIL